MIKTVYVYAKSKKAANEMLLAGDVRCTEYTMVDQRPGFLNKQPNGTVIKIYEKMVGGSPYAKAYGTWNAEKKKIM